MNFPTISYREFLYETHKEDCRQNWVIWKSEYCGMGHKQALKASYDVDWGYTPLKEEVNNENY